VAHFRPSGCASGSPSNVDPSPDRVSPPCPEVARGCGACSWQHVDFPVQGRLKSAIVVQALERAGVACPAPGSVELPPWAFRTTIRAAVTDGRAGYLQTRSHEIVHVAQCLIAHPLLKPLLVDGRYPGATEVVLRCGARTGERLVQTIPSGLAVDLPDDVLTGHFHERAAGRLWRISARSFFQTRPDGVDALARLVARYADELGAASTAIDLYSGVGLFGGVLAQRGWSVTAIERSPGSVRDAKTNLADLPVRTVCADVDTWVPDRAELVVADPSRLGLGSKGADVVASSGARRLVLVSCDATSLGRDAALLRDRGYVLSAVTGVDLFAHTFRVEVVSVFDR
jgi:23S rRNA (uracil1939-C5)-methyltransferase